MKNNLIVVNARFLTQKVTGVQRFAIEISKIISRLSSQIVFVTPNGVLDAALAKELNVVIIGKHTGTIWEQLDLRNYLKSNNNPLLVNFCNTGLLFYSNQIVTIHDMSYKVNPKWFSKKFYVWYNFLIPHIAAHSVKVLTVSNSSKADIVKYLGTKETKIDVIYNAPLVIANERISENKDGDYILTISSQDPRKNLNNLIKAFKRLNQDVKLVIVGLKSHNFGAGLDENLINDHIIIKGYVPDDELVSLMKHSKAFVYLSLYEGFGLPPLEAMAIGCPVLVSDIAALKETCGDAAIYADPYDLDDIKNKISNLLSDGQLREQLIIKGSENIKKYSWQASANKVFKVINEFV